MNKTNNSKLTSNAKILRKNMTREERHLWYAFLKTLPTTVNRQKVIGNYIVDFYIAASKIVIELDGSQHYEYSGIESDAIRDEFLNSLGVKVLRYSNSDINQRFDSVCQDILNHINTSSVTFGDSFPSMGSLADDSVKQKAQTSTHFCSTPQITAKPYFGEP